MPCHRLVKSTTISTRIICTESFPSVEECLSDISRRSNANTSDADSELHIDTRDEINALDIATALVVLKKQHRLSTRCIDDILKLLNTLLVPNTPTSWHQVKKLLSNSKPASINQFICPSCSHATTSEHQCVHCSTIHRSRLPSLRTFSITEQIANILINNTDLDLRYQATTTAICDIRDGAMYRTLRNTTAERTLTLTLNIDGVQPSRNTQTTIWPIIMVINELPLKRRFALENIILAGVWSAKSKPSRDSVKLFLQPVINELRELEKGYPFMCSDGVYSVVLVHLIAACCDKPAQALIQCIPEPIAAHGCGQCEVEG
jgi:hypothetical protein